MNSLMNFNIDIVKYLRDAIYVNDTSAILLHRKFREFLGKANRIICFQYKMNEGKAIFKSIYTYYTLRNKICKTCLRIKDDFIHILSYLILILF